MTIEISPEVGARLIDEAQKQGTSVEILLQRLMDEREVKAPAARKGSVSKLPSLHLGAVGSLRREEIYDDVD
jgi:hypothetical protein